jgi:hypothetical protein
MFRRGAKVRTLAIRNLFDRRLILIIASDATAVMSHHIGN